MQDNKARFNDRFSNYVQNKVSRQRTDSLFNGQFTQKAEAPLSSAFPFPTLHNLTAFSHIKKMRQAEEHQKEASTSFRFSEFEFENEKGKKQHFEEENFPQRKRLKKLREVEQEEQRLKNEIVEDQAPTHRRRLKKLRELEENECAICLDQIKKRCQLKCKHKFCFECLRSWFDTSNKCPCCRAEIDTFWHQGEQFTVEPKEPELEDSESEESDRLMDYPCYNCEETLEGDTVLICDQCELNACHVDCDPFLRGRLPRGEWTCHFCR